MGNSITRVLDPARHRPGGVNAPTDYPIPDFPSLYIPSFTVTQKELGIYIYEAETIWRFTLYWTFILCGLIFFLTSLLASFSLLLSLTVFRENVNASKSTSSKGGETPPATDGSPTGRRRSRIRKRPPLWPVILLPLFAVGLAALIALITGTVVGFALAAIYSAGGFSMSTWVPFLWALITVLVLIISSYSTLTSIL